MPDLGWGRIDPDEPECRLIAARVFYLGDAGGHSVSPFSRK